MARRKTPPLTLQTKHALAERIMTLRIDLFGPRGGPELARRLGIPVRTWYNYEGGITVPGEILLLIIEVTSVEPMWLLHGTGPRFSNAPAELRKTMAMAATKTDDLAASPLNRGIPSSAQVAVRTLLRAALRLLGNDPAEISEDDEHPLRLEDVDSSAAALELEARFPERYASHNGDSSANGTRP
jgi:hypothetical protein